jgi:hypothetical protein
MADERIGEQDKPVELRWRVHLLTENLWKSALMLIIIGLSLYGAWLWTGLLYMVLAGGLLMMAFLGSYFFPVDYRLDENGIDIRILGVTTSKKWDEFRNYYAHSDGAHLSTFKRPGPLDSFRGNYIRYSPGDREKILGYLDEYIGGRKADRQSEQEKPEG